MNYPTRKPNRLKDYDYSQNGAYFVTVCTHNRENLFWTVGADIIRPQLSITGEIVRDAIENISKIYSGIQVNKYVILNSN